MESIDGQFVARNLYEQYSTLSSPNKLYALVEDVLGASNSMLKNGVNIRQFINDTICAHYPNEAVVKAAFVKQVLALQGARNTVVFEMPVMGSRVDIAKLGASSYAFEIKTEFDTFDRLQKQLADYASIFEYVYLIIPHETVDELPVFVPEGCGIYAYRRKRGGELAFVRKRRAAKNANLDARGQLESLPIAVLREKAKLHGTEKDELVDRLLESLSPTSVNHLFKSYYKQKYLSQWQFLLNERHRIYDIDYGWFYHNNFDPDEIYYPGSSARRSLICWM